MYKKEKIGSLDLIYSPFAGFEGASLGVFLNVGARFEKKKQKGIAHFLEHMLFKGSLNYSYKKIKREIEGRGGFLNGFTSQEMTAYYACFLKKNTLLTLDILLDMVLNPSFLSREIKKEKGVVLEEIKMYNDLPSARARAILDSLLWVKHPLGEDVIGFESSIKELTKKNLLDFQNNFYRASNMVVSFCGDFPLAGIKKIIEKKLKTTSEGRRPRQKNPPQQTGIRIKVEKKDIQQVHLCLGFRSVSYRSDKRIIQKLLHVILGANMSSRLFENLRERKSLCYDVSTEVREFKDSGAFIVRLGLDKEKIKLALSAIKKELTKIKNHTVGKSELTRAKDYFLGQFSMGLEHSQGRMFYLAQSYINFKKIKSLDAVKKQVESVEPYQIRDFAVKLFSFKDFSLSVVGNVAAELSKEIKEILEDKDEKK